MTIHSDADCYQIRLSPAAMDRGERVYGELLNWQGVNLARVRIIASTVPGYHFGRIGLVERERLILVRRGRTA